MSVRIRMKKLGRKHRPFFRICAIDQRTARDGRVLEELGTYDPLVPDTDARALFHLERVAYWLGVGAQPSDKVKILIKKYGPNGTHLEKQRDARERLAMPKIVPDAGKPTFVPTDEPAPVAAAAESSESASEASEPAAE